MDYKCEIFPYWRYDSPEEDGAYLIYRYKDNKGYYEVAEWKHGYWIVDNFEFSGSYLGVKAWQKLPCPPPHIKEIPEGE